MEPDDNPVGGAMLRDGPGKMGEHTRLFVENEFHLCLNLSVAWIDGGIAVPARFESLWDEPSWALRSLSDAILPVPEERLLRAVSLCELGAERLLKDDGRERVPRDGVGGWVEVLPADIRRLLATLDPYPAQFAALGYTMDPDDAANARRPTPARAANRFGYFRCFDNGVPVAPAIVCIYYDLPDSLRQRWLDPCLTEGDSFFAWLNRPAAADPWSGIIAPAITELGAYIYASRTDVSEKMPDLYGRHRVGFTGWFLSCAIKEYGLDRVFSLPVVHSWNWLPGSA
jgi:hypothetical protein